MMLLFEKNTLLMKKNLQESSADWFKSTNETLNIKGNIILCKVLVL